ncbi:MAG: hypothetical protein AMXMBFR34_25860 [Myxococcaceae bacterium]
MGRYQLLFMLGQGGMGEVHLAKLSGAAGFEKLCIVKTILPQMQADPQFVDRFHHEARVLVHLNHSNIAQVYDMGDVEGTLYMAIEYVPGVDLARVQSRAAHAGAQVPVPIALFLGQRVADALGYAHRKTGPDGAPLGIVHRDVSPQNVMVSYEGEVKVIDFGLAKSAVRSKHTLPSTVMGKLGYMSPEQAMAQPVDHRSDIYSAGIVVWELIAGRPLFEGATMAEMVVKMAQPSIPTLRSVRPEVSANLDRVVMRALAVDPAARYGRADEFARTLNELAVREALTIGAEDVGNYVRAMCSEEFAAERALQSKLSVMRKRGQALATPLPEPEIEGTLLRPSSPGAPAAELTPAQRALSVSEAPGRGQHKAISQHGAAHSQSGRGRTLVAPKPVEAEEPSAPVAIPRSKTPWIVVGVLGVAAAGVLTAAFLKSRQPPEPQPAPVVEAPVEPAEPPAGEDQKPQPGEEKPAEEKPAEDAAKPIGTVAVAGPVFKVQQSGDKLLVLLKDKRALKKGDQLELIGDPAGEKTAPLYGEGVVMSVVDGMAELGVYDEPRLPARLFAMKDSKPTAATAQRTVGKPKKAVVAVAGASEAERPATKAEGKGEPKVAAEEPIVPAMEPDNPFDRKGTPTKVEAPKAEGPKVEQSTAAQPAQVAPAAAGTRQVTGTVQLIGLRAQAMVRLTNRSAFSLTGCRLRLPGPVMYSFTKEIYSGAPADVPMAAFRASPAHVSDAQFEKGWAPLFCNEGTGFLRLMDQRQ